MSIEETIEKALPELNFKLKTKEDLKKFYEQNLNKKLPLDGPLWRIYLQNNGFEGNHAVSIYKAHHCLGDGVS